MAVTFVTIFSLLVWLACCQNAEGVSVFPFRNRPLISAPAALPGLKAPLASTILQRLDHLDIADTRTWQQRYYINDQLYAPGGPIFIMMGTEGPGSLNWLRGGQMMELALFYKAKAFSLEQRFHGESIPTPDMSLESLAYSTPEQSIDDLAYFISSIKISHPVAKVVVFGGSFGGTLAAWAQQKYPELIDGVVASSAPFQAQVDFYEYLGEVGNVMALADEACYNDMKDATAAAKDLLFGSDHGGQDVADLFNLCGIDNSSQMDVYLFFLVFSEIYSSLVQGAHSLADVQDSCDLITNPVYGTTPLERLAEITTTIFNPSGCISVNYYAYLALNQNTSWESPAVPNRIFMHQSCAHFGDFHSSNHGLQPFGDAFPIEVFIKMCTDYFSPSFDLDFVEAAVAETNSNYFAVNPSLTNAVLVQGSLDPWRLLGIWQDLSPTATVLFIEGASHVTDMGTASVSDSPELTAARLQIRDLVGQWIAQ